MPADLAGCYVISLRPVGGHAAMRRAAARAGARVLALSPWRLAGRDDAATRRRLRAALAAPLVVFTSPAAVRHAHALQPLRARRGQRWCAIGTGTAAALRRAGIRDVLVPERMDSEGLLALPALAAARGATLLRADVYERLPVRPAPRALAQLRALAAPAWLAVSSGEALQQLLAVLPNDAQAALRRARLVAASPRLADAARALGFGVAAVADSARPAALVAAAAQASAPARRRARGT